MTLDFTLHTDVFLLLGTKYFFFFGVLWMVSYTIKTIRSS